MANLVPSLSPDVFNQGAVRVNSDALTNYIVNTQARNRARDDAFAKYLATEGNNINEKGVRAQDLPVILDAKNAWQQHSIQNRRALQNPSIDGGKAYADNQKLYNTAKALIPQSQAAGLNNKESEGIIADPKKSGLLVDGSMAAYHKSTLPINDPNYQAWDHADIYNPKPVDLNRLSREVNKIQATYTPGEPVPAAGGMQTITSTKSFKPEDLQAFSIRGEYEYNHNNSLKKEIDETVADHDSPLYHQLNDLYKSHFGKDIEHPEEATTALMMSLHGSPQSKTQTMKAPVVKPTADEKFDQWKMRKDYSNAHRPPKAASGKVADTSTPAEDDWNSLVSEAKKTGAVPYTHYEGGKPVSTEKEYILPTTPEFLRKFAVTDQVAHKTLIPKDLRLSEDGKTVRPLYANSDISSTGNQGVITGYSKKYPVEKVKDLYGATKYTKTQVLKEKKILASKQKDNDPLGILPK